MAPSKLQRPSGDRVKSDATDAVNLACALRLDEVTSVNVLRVEQAACYQVIPNDGRAWLLRVVDTSIAGG